MRRKVMVAAHMLRHPALFRWFTLTGQVNKRTRQREFVQRQEAEDTCATHGVFCCPQCFNMSIVC